MVKLNSDDENAAKFNEGVEALTAPHRDRACADQLDHAYQTFLVNNVFEGSSTPQWATRAYLNRLWAAFPTAFISICDAIVDPFESSLPKDEQIELREQIANAGPAMKAIVDDYRKYRDHVWRELTLAVPRLPYWIASESAAFFKMYFESGRLDFDPHAGQLEVFMGSTPLFSLVPDQT